MTLLSLLSTASSRSADVDSSVLRLLRVDLKGGAGDSSKSSDLSLIFLLLVSRFGLLTSSLASSSSLTSLIFLLREGRLADLIFLESSSSETLINAF